MPGNHHPRWLREGGDELERAVAALKQTVGDTSSLVEGVNRMLEGRTGCLRRVPAGTCIWEHGSVAVDSFAVLEGAIRVELPGEPPTLLALVLPGELADYEFLGHEPRHFGRAVALADSVLIRGGEAALVGFVGDDPERMLMALRHAATMRDLTLRRLAALNAGKVARRVARLLLLLFDRVGRREAKCLCLDLKVTRTDLAQLVGCRRESVSRCLSDLQRQGVITCSGDGFRLLDGEALREQARVP